VTFAELAAAFLLPLTVVTLLWLGLTAGLMLLNRAGRRPARIALLLSAPLVLAAHQTVLATADDQTLPAAYLAFGAGMIIWAWHELSFYSGVLTGPRPAALPPGSRGFMRLWYALGTHLYHEIACLLEMALLAWLLRDALHGTALLAFVLSWAMQQSAKLNVLYGARALQTEMFPRHLAFLASYWQPARSNPFFRPSVSITSLLALLCWFSVAVQLPDPAGVRMALIAALLSLGALEHWLLIVPARTAAAARAPAAD
jgi:putative photosynthetic complex assembly protein 2